ncbi:MAG: TIGR02584 family CRISPR-associated protein [Magnetococcales bacterium]|nr:TIGR02584 family CRISPR-associated protein [Magnetococcales bacterium]
MSQPDSCRLLISLGLSPQIISSSLYALMIIEKKTFVDIHVLTSPEGARAVGNIFFLGSDNPLDRFCRDYAIPRGRVVFSREQVHILWPEHGARSLVDTPCLDRLFSLLAHWTANGAEPLVACIAGGRKDMAVLFAQVFGLLAREEDCLTHLLTSKEFENLAEFFYPPPHPTAIMVHRLGRGVEYLNTREAEVRLVNLPLVRLRPLQDEATLKGLVPLAAARIRTQNGIAAIDPAIHVRIDAGTLTLNGVTTHLPPRELAVWLFFAHSRKEGRGREGWIAARTFDEPEIVAALEECYRKAIGTAGEKGSFVPRIKGGNVEYNELKTKLTHAISKIKRRLGSSHPARVDSRRGRGGREYGIGMDPDHIHIEG